MPLIDWTSFINSVLSGVVGLFFGGFIGASITYRFDRKRDDLRWQRDRQQQEAEWEHEKEVRLRELEARYQEEKNSDIKRELLRGVDRPTEAIAEAQRWISLKLPVRREIRGGWTEASDKNLMTFDYVEIFEVKIHGIPHSIMSLGLPPREQIIIGEEQRLLTVRVVGESMNRAGISDGDYVLARIQSSVESGDIVIAEVSDKDSKAIIKRFERRGDKLILKSDSTYPEFTSYAISKPIEGFRILGVAVAVFKPQYLSI